MRAIMAFVFADVMIGSTLLSKIDDFRSERC